ncbi:hypothetical protein [Enterovibrio norvegicus]|uniref:Secreted protein n=1 Tax=Enterovibrio norvegicus TaxID=188144 RepID=A0A2N7L9D1_9GAMM|nr:hypothetical protein [Enterovibrio norvegicus]PMN91058.1 hypothetical protein BCT23_18290 [Enterovibrio norvegicus]
MCNHAALDRLAFRSATVFSAVLMLVISAPAFTSEEVNITEVVEVDTISESNPMTAIEIIIGKRIPATVIQGDRPPHVYRPRTPIFHHHHPENTPVEPEIRKHLLVDHPELNNNQGRKVRPPISVNDTKVESDSTP